MLQAAHDSHLLPRQGQLLCCGSQHLHTRPDPAVQVQQQPTIKLSCSRTPQASLRLMLCSVPGGLMARLGTAWLTDLLESKLPRLCPGRVLLNLPGQVHEGVSALTKLQAN